MKRFLLIFASFLALSSYAQDLDKKIARSFSGGDVGSIAANIDSEVELSIEGARERVKQGEAAEQINQFLNQLSAPRFTLIHKSDRRDAGFIIGNLQSGKITYRINISFNKVDGKEMIQTIRIEESR